MSPLVELLSRNMCEHLEKFLDVFATSHILATCRSVRTRSMLLRRCDLLGVLIATMQRKAERARQRSLRLHQQSEDMEQAAEDVCALIDELI